ncbi:RHS repeat-associated core domain-containing protein [Pseudomonas sp. R37(2017)]|uniref:RHS repeat-associated core domain-containing protein n=1 Tax=Pseudomonas sp. R37(2017) TaxID=1981685 RepID=UPI002113F864|nr:RHS repeat-associated core domain-containing protein [Pseudomonas sp. R37(2017)]
MHRHTPTLSVIDPRRAVVREVAYHRCSDQQVPQTRITQYIYSIRERASHSRDPRLFALHEHDGSVPANQTIVTTLTGLPLLSINVDAGWRLSLYGAGGQRLEDWDQKRNRLRMTYDSSLRPERGFESALGDELCTACFAYGDGSEESASHNRCGQLIRHDDCAGSQHFTEFSLLGARLQQTRRFLVQVQSPNWPEDETEREKLLEPQGALTQISVNSVGDWVRHIDALGNEQNQRQTVAGELFEARIRLAGADDEITLMSDIQYNAFGQIVQQSAGNGVVSRAAFDPEDGRLATLHTQLASQPPLQHLTYAYDPIGNPIRMTDDTQPIRYSRNQSVAAISTWQYDTLGQLIEANGRQRCNAPGGPHLPAFVSPPAPDQLENYHQTFSYDASGNLQILQHHADSASRTERTSVATLSNRSLPWGDGTESPGDHDIDAAYDVCGNLKVLQRGQALHWDARNRLSQVDQVVREDEPADTEIYVYDGEDQRVRKIRTTDTGTLIRTHETRYLPGVEIRTSPNETLHVISVQCGRCTVRILHWDRGSPPEGSRNQLRYCLADHLESSTLELDKDARLISQENYYPYGGTAWWAGRDKVEASYKTIRYSGKERDATGLYYYGFRYYMPWRQRWVNADPAGAIDGLNLYRMVRNNPVSYSDPVGLVAKGVSHTVEFHGVPRHDTNFNNIEKAKKETFYAVSLIRNPASISGAISELSLKLHDLILTMESDPRSLPLLTNLVDRASGEEEYGRVSGGISEIKSILGSDAPLSPVSFIRKVQTLKNYGAYVVDRASKAIDEHAFMLNGASAKDVSSLMSWYMPGDLFNKRGRTGIKKKERRDDSGILDKETFSALSDDEKGFLIVPGLSRVRPLFRTFIHERDGGEVISTSPFVNRTFDNDSPMLASISGSTSCIMIGATILKPNLSDDDERSLAKAAVAFLVGAGYHSVTEVLDVAYPGLNLY